MKLEKAAMKKTYKHFRRDNFSISMLPFFSFFYLPYMIKTRSCKPRVKLFPDNAVFHIPTIQAHFLGEITIDWVRQYVFWALYAFYFEAFFCLLFLYSIAAVTGIVHSTILQLFMNPFRSGNGLKPFSSSNSATKFISCCIHSLNCC